MSGRQWLNISALGLLAFIWAASAIIGAAIPIAILATTRHIIIAMDIPDIAAAGIMAAARDITVEARQCRPSKLFEPCFQYRRCWAGERQDHHCVKAA